MQLILLVTVAAAAIFIRGDSFSLTAHSKSNLSRGVRVQSKIINVSPVEATNAGWTPTALSLSAISPVVPQLQQLPPACGLFAAVLKRPPQAFLVVTAIVATLVLWLRRITWLPSRTYDREKNTVGKEYDAWTTEGILEYYWGEHIHLGYYTEEDRLNGYKKKNFIQAKYDFIDKMAEFGGISHLNPSAILDVGCGIGGTSRYLAKKFGSGTTVTGITVLPCFNKLYVVKIIMVCSSFHSSK